MDEITCGVCFRDFNGTTPQVGHNIECVHCKAIGHATYSRCEFMYYMIEWEKVEEKEKQLTIALEVTNKRSDMLKKMAKPLIRKCY